MKLSQESKKRILEAYIGDLYWFSIIKQEVTKTFAKMQTDLEYDYEKYNIILKLIDRLYEMNSIIIETETEEYAEKYHEKAHNLYSEMKIDLTKMIGYEEMWEELC